MRIVALALALLAAGSALAQAPQRARTPAVPRAAAAELKPSDGIDPATRKRQDDQQKRWDETNRKAIGGICSGC